MNIHEIDLNLLRVLVVMLEEQNVTRAARRLGLSQPATSAALARLRSLFDDRLFVRTRAGMRATARALALREPLRAALAMLRDVVPRPAFDPRTARGTVRIVATDYGATIFAPPLFRLFAAEAPGVELRFEGEGGRSVDVGLRAEAFDLAIGAFRVFAPPFHQQVLFVEEPVIAMRRGHPARRRVVRGRLRPDDFARYPHVEVAVYRAEGSLAQDLASEAGLTPAAPRHVVAHVNAALHVVRNGDALTVVGRRFVEALGPAHGLAIVLPPRRFWRVPVSLLWHDHTDDDPLRAWLRAQIVAIGAARAGATPRAPSKRSHRPPRKRP